MSGMASHQKVRHRPDLGWLRRAKKRSPNDLLLLRLSVLARASGCPSAPRSPSAALATRPLGEHRYLRSYPSGCQCRERHSSVLGGKEGRLGCACSPYRLEARWSYRRIRRLKRTCTLWLATKALGQELVL